MPISTAFAPATVANLGVGFDIVGLALHEPGDTVRAEWSDDHEPGVRIGSIDGDGGKLSRDPAKNSDAGAIEVYGIYRGDLSLNEATRSQRFAFGGVLQTGRSAEGRYVFSVPEDARDVVTVTVGYAAGAPFLVFTGSAA